MGLRTFKYGLRKTAIRIQSVSKHNFASTKIFLVRVTRLCLAAQASGLDQGPDMIAFARVDQDIGGHIGG